MHDHNPLCYGATDVPSLQPAHIKNKGKLFIIDDNTWINNNDNKFIFRRRYRLQTQLLRDQPQARSEDGENHSG